MVEAAYPWADELSDLMLNFNLVDLMHALWMLDFYERASVLPAVHPSMPPPSQARGLLSLATLDSNAYNEPPENNKISEIDIGHAKEIIEAVGKIARELDLKTAKHRLSHFALALRYSMLEAEYKSEIRVLRDALKHDLSERHFYHYPQAKIEVLMKFTRNGTALRQRFRT